MDFQLNNILVTIKFADYSFVNPLELKFNEDGPVIGMAALTNKKDKLFANLTINKHLDYHSLYPRLAIDVTTKQIGYVFLSGNLGFDPEVKTIKEQIADPVA